jgi:hypothetical protein
MTTATQDKKDVQTPLCGHQINLSKGIKPCVKPAGHDTVPAIRDKHGVGHVSRIVNRDKQVKLPPKTTFAKLDLLDDDDAVAYGAGRGASAAVRTDEQKSVDSHVKDIHDAWVAKGKPSEFNKSPRAKYWVKPDEEEGARAMLRSAERYMSGQLKIQLSVRIAPLAKHESGRHMLVWTVMERTQNTKAEPETPAENGSQPDAEG